MTSTFTPQGASAVQKLVKQAKKLGWFLTVYHMTGIFDARSLWRLESSFSASAFCCAQTHRGFGPFDNKRWTADSLVERHGYVGGVPDGPLTQVKRVVFEYVRAVAIITGAPRGELQTQ